MKLTFVSKRFRGERFEPRACGDEWIMLVDLDRCIGCGACALACQIEHDAQAGAGNPARPIVPGTGEVHARMVCLPGTCRHCPTPCEYRDEYNFWAICPSLEAKAATAAFCDACSARLAQDQWPACATRCTMKTIYFGRAPEMALILGEKRLREMGDVEHDG
ncbi:MAG: 4Fe-4S binding protein [Betaproteobacteria bacterium]|nr:4Fe-4S binding protein [Betaproteobacteria bacterium]